MVVVERVVKRKRDAAGIAEDAIDVFTHQASSRIFAPDWVVEEDMITFRTPYSLLSDLGDLQ